MKRLMTAATVGFVGTTGGVLFVDQVVLKPKETKPLERDDYISVAILGGIAATACIIAHFADRLITR